MTRPSSVLEGGFASSICRFSCCLYLTAPVCIAAANVSTVCSDERTCRNSEGACFTCGLLRTDNFRNDNNSVNEDLELLAEYRRLDTVKSMKHPRVGAGGRYSVVRHDSRVREWLDNIGEDVQMQVDEAVHDAAKYFGPVRPNRWCSGLTPSLTICDDRCGTGSVHQVSKRLCRRVSATDDHATGSGTVSGAKSTAREAPPVYEPHECSLRTSRGLVIISRGVAVSHTGKALGTRLGA